MLIDKLCTCPAIKNILSFKESLDFKSMNKENLEDKLAITKAFRKRTVSVENLCSTISQDKNNFNNKVF